MQMRRIRLHNKCHCLLDLLLLIMHIPVKKNRADCVAMDDAEHPGDMDKGPARACLKGPAALALHILA